MKPKKVIFLNQELVKENTARLPGGLGSKCMIRGQHDTCFTVEPDAFQGDITLIEVNLTTMITPSLPDGFFRNLTNLERLDFLLCGMSSFPDCRGLSNLTSISWSNNKLQEPLPDDTFQFLTNLKNLSLVTNEMKSLPNFRNLFKLETLNLSSNPIMLSGGVFQGLINLKRLDLSRCKLTSLPAGIFDNLVNLDNLSLRINQFGSSLSGDLFQHLTNLTDLDLVLAGLTSVPGTIFRGLTKISRLLFIGNKLPTLPVDLFLDLSNLRNLSLTDNGIQTLPAAIFRPLTRLTSLSLDGNVISFPDGIFQHLTALASLSFSKCGLVSLPNDIFLDVFNLTTLQLAGNKLSSFGGGVFRTLTKLTSLNLGDAGITLMSADIFQGLIHLNSLSLNGNNISFPPGCAVFQDLGNLKILDMTKCGLNLLPVNSFPDLVHLSSLVLSGNKICFQDGGFEVLVNLKTLKLEECSITSLPEGAFRGLLCLEELDLAHNQISTLPVNIIRDLSTLKKFDIRFNCILTLPGTMFEQNTNLEEIRVSDIGQKAVLPVNLFLPLHKLSRVSIQNSLDRVPLFHSQAPLTSFCWNHKTVANFGLSLGDQALLADTREQLATAHWPLYPKNFTDCLTSLHGRNPFTHHLSENLILNYEQMVAFNMPLPELSDFKEPEKIGFCLLNSPYPFSEPPVVYKKNVFLVAPRHSYIFDLQQLDDSVQLLMLPFCSFRSNPTLLNQQLQEKGWRSPDQLFVGLTSSRLLVLGNGGVGKTALLNKLGLKKPFWTEEQKTNDEDTLSTVGFDVGEIDLGERKLFVSDFAGQLEYTTIHQHFISDRPNSQAIILLVDAALHPNQLVHTRNWLMMLRERSQTEVSVVVSKIDLIDFNPEIEQKIKTRIIALCAEYGFHDPPIFFSSIKSEQRIKLLKDHLFELAEETTFKKFVPKIFLEIEKELQQAPEAYRPILSVEKLRAKLSNKLIETEYFEDYWNGFLNYQAQLGVIVFEQKQQMICTDPTGLSKAAGLVIGPSAHFYGVKGGRSAFQGGIIPFAKLHELFSFQGDLVPNKREEETKVLLSFFSSLGICRLMTPGELKGQSFGSKDEVYEFFDLCDISDLPFLPSEPDAADYKVLAIEYENVTQYLFTTLRKSLVNQKDPLYRSSLNSILVRRGQKLLNAEGKQEGTYNLELWFHKETKLFIVIRGNNLNESLRIIEQTITQNSPDPIRNTRATLRKINRTEAQAVLTNPTKAGASPARPKNELRPGQKYQFLCGRCCQEGKWIRIPLNGKCQGCQQPLQKMGNPQIPRRYPWSPGDFKATDFKLYEPGSDLEILELKLDDPDPEKREEFERVSRMLQKFLQSDKDSSKFAQVLQIDKIEFFRNKRLEKQFEEEFHTLTEASLKRASDPAQIPPRWNDQQRKTLQCFSKFTVPVSGTKDINLVPAWRGAGALETYYKIGNSNHLTPEELVAQGIPRLDPGFFGKGIYMTQLPSYGFLYASSRSSLLLSWVLMGQVYPVTEGVGGQDSLNGQPLKEGFNSHYVLVKRAGISQFADVQHPDKGPDGDELVVGRSQQCLPRYLVHFKKVPRTRDGREALLEMRNANIILWLDPHLQGSSYHNWMNHHLEPPRLCVTINFWDLQKLREFVLEYQDLTSKIKIVIHLNPTQKYDALFEPLILLISNKTEILAGIPTLIYLGSKEELIEIKETNKIAKTFFQKNIFKKPLKNAVNKQLLCYSQSRFELLSYCTPPTPLFALPRHEFGVTSDFIPNLVKNRHLLISVLSGSNLKKRSSVVCVVGFRSLDSPENLMDIQETPARDGTNPVWGHSILYHMNQFPAPLLVVQLRVSGKPIGEVVVPLIEMETQNPCVQEFNIVGFDERSRNEGSSSGSKKQSEGKLQISWELSDCPLFCPILAGNSTPVWAKPSSSSFLKRGKKIRYTCLSTSAKPFRVEPTASSCSVWPIRKIQTHSSP